FSGDSPCGQPGARYVEGMGGVHRVGKPADGTARGPWKALPMGGRNAGPAREGSGRSNCRLANRPAEPKESTVWADSRLDWRGFHSSRYAQRRNGGGARLRTLQRDVPANRGRFQSDRYRRNERPLFDAADEQVTISENRV